jgi:hypothetical protein
MRLLTLGITASVLVDTKATHTSPMAATVIIHCSNYYFSFLAYINVHSIFNKYLSRHIAICPDINECDYPDLYPCYGDCKNTRRGYDCQCPLGFKGNASKQNGCEGKIIQISSRIMLSLYGDWQIIS